MPAQETLANPFGMDEDCTNCARCERRERVVHGYGDAGAEALFVGVEPTAGAERTGVPFTGDAAGRRLQRVLGELGFSNSTPDDPEPDLQGVYLAYLARCHHPTRPPAEDEVVACEPFLNAELRTINPHLLVPVGQRAFEALAADHTTRDPDAVDAVAEHATTVRGRGFDVVPMRALDGQDDAETAAFVEHVRADVF